jgi:DNA polymerase-3 subunit delta
VKYQNPVSFARHLAGAFPDNPSPVYLIVAPSTLERKEEMEAIVQFVRRSHPEAALFSWSGGMTSAQEVARHLASMNLFAERQVVIFDRVDEAADLEALIPYLLHPVKEITLLLGAEEMKPLADLYQQGKREMVVLDLSQEKPWERERRIREWIMERARKEGMPLSSEAAAALLLRVGVDAPALDQELKKLSCFAWGRGRIESSDVETLVAVRTSPTHWLLAERVIWKGETLPRDKKGDIGALLGLVGLFRYHLQLGYELATSIEQGVKFTGEMKNFPSLKSGTLDRYLPVARERGSAPFQRGLAALFDLEYALKNSPVDPSVPFDRFLGRFRT